MNPANNDYDLSEKDLTQKEVEEYLIQLEERTKQIMPSNAYQHVKPTKQEIVKMYHCGYLFRHELTEMTEEDMNTAFLERAFEYLNKGEFESFLQFHYERYRHDPAIWLEHIIELSKSIEYYCTEKSPIKLLYLKKIATEWIMKKRKELNELRGIPNETHNSIIEVDSIKSESQFNLVDKQRLIEKLISFGVMDLEFVASLSNENREKLLDRIFARHFVPNPPKMKEQLVLLHQIGILDLPSVKAMLLKEQEKEIGNIIGFKPDKVGDSLRNLDLKSTTSSDNPYLNLSNLRNVEKFLCFLKSNN